MKPKTHVHEWEFIAESRWSSNEWCSTCGAWRRHDYEDDRTRIMLPKVKP